MKEWKAVNTDNQIVKTPKGGQVKQGIEMVKLTDRNWKASIEKYGFSPRFYVFNNKVYIDDGDLITPTPYQEAKEYQENKDFLDLMVQYLSTQPMGVYLYPAKLQRWIKVPLSSSEFVKISKYDFEANSFINSYTVSLTPFIIN